MGQNKSCIVVTAFTEGQPGFLDFAYRIKSLAAHYRLTVVSAFPLTTAELQLPNVDYVIIDSGEGRIGWLQYLWRCSRLLRQRRPALAVLLHSMASPVALLAGGIPTVVYWNEHPTHAAPVPDGFAPVKHMLRASVRWLMFEGARKASLAMPIGEAHWDDLLAHGCAANRTRMLYMGVDQSFSGVASPQQSWETGTLLQLIYVGSVCKDRGRDVMLEAMALANRERAIAHLTIVGASEDQLKHCLDYAQALGIRESVTILGRVSGHAIPAYFSKADAGLCLWEDQPWYRFNPPTKLFEYLVAGLPVLASNIRTHTRYVEDGKNGLIFEYDSNSLAAAITRLWEHRAELPAMKHRAADAGERYVWQIIEPDFLQAVEGVIR